MTEPEATWIKAASASISDNSTAGTAITWAFSLNRDPASPRIRNAASGRNGISA